MIITYANKFVALVNQPVAYRFGMGPYRRGAWPEAERHFRKAVTHAPHHAASHFKLGMCRFRQGEWSEARAHFEEAIRRDPTRKEWNKQLQQAIRHQDQGTVVQPIPAEAHILQKVKARPNASESHIALAAHHKKMGKRWLEIEALETAVRLGAKSSSVYFNLGDALESMRRFRAAASAFSQASQINPKSAETWYRAGYALARSGHDGDADPAAARDCYSQATKSDKDLGAERFGVGVFHQKRGHWESAAQAYEEQLPKRPADAELLYRLGLSYDRCYQWEAAERAYMSALAFEPTRTGWHERLGLVRERMGKWMEAYQAYRAAAVQPSKAMECQYRALLCLRQASGEREAATYLRQEILREPAPSAGLQPVNQEFLDSEIQLESYFSDLRAHATLHLRSMVERQPLSSENWLALGKFQEQNSQSLAAAESFKECLRRTSSYMPDIQIRLSQCLAKGGEDTSAIEAFLDSRKLRLPHGTSLPDYKTNHGFRIRAEYAEYLETLAVDKSVVLYESFHGASISCNPFAIFLALKKRPEYAAFFHVWVVSEDCEIPKEIEHASNVAVVRRGSDAYVRYLATAGFLINNVSFPEYFVRRDDQIYLNTWHGTPIKFLGKDIKDSLLAHKNVARNFLNASHLLTQNAYTTDILLSRYDIKDTFAGVVLESGYPRVDRTLALSSQDIGELRKRLGCKEGDKLVLYAPTWRGLHGSATIDKAALLADLEAMRASGHRVIMRAHHMVENLVRSLPIGDMVVPSDIDSNILLGAVDALITDYSSIAFDFFVQRKPVIYYAFDIAEYERERGLYFPLTDLPGHVVFDRETLVDTLHDLDFDTSSEYDDAVQRFCPHDDGAAADRVIDQVFGRRCTPALATESTGHRHRLLFYVGPFIPNGILTSFLNLMRTLPPSEFAITVVVDPESISGSEERLDQFAKLPSHVSVIGKVGQIVATIEEAWVLGKFRAQNNVASPEMMEILSHCFQREFRRMFGDAQFDAVVNFEGYNVNWVPLFAFAPEANARRRILFQHNEMHAEWVEKYSYLESTFRLYRRFTSVLSVAEQTRILNADELASRFDVPQELFGLAHNVQDGEHVLRCAQETPMDPLYTELFSGERRVFITLGRMSVEKDHAKLIDAFAQVAAETREATLVIFGEGPLRASLEAQVQQLGLTGRVHMPGRIENPFPWLTRADCFVLSSNHEGQPMVLLEAMTLGKPIIASRIPGCESVLGDHYGLLVDNSVEGLATGMREFLAGRVSAGRFDLASYNAEAVRMFRAGVLGLTN